MQNGIATISILAIAILAISFIAIFGFQKKAVKEKLSEKVKKRQEIIDKFIDSIRNSGSTVIQPRDGITAVEKVNMELLISSNENMKRLAQSIERFDRSSTRLASAMLVLTIVMLFLVGLQVWVMMK